jgi:hypothetical protein
LRFGSKAKATRYSPPAALKRSSFILAWQDPFCVSTRGRPNCGPNRWRRRDNARISVCTSSCSASNSGSNSSPISTTQLTLLIWHAIHMMSNPYRGSPKNRRIFYASFRILDLPEVFWGSSSRPLGWGLALRLPGLDGGAHQREQPSSQHPGSSSFLILVANSPIPSSFVEVSRINSAVSKQC